MNTNKFYSFLLIAVLVSISLLLSACGGRVVVDTEAKAKNIDAAERGFTLKDRMGVDDQASLAILYGAEMQGSLETCG